MIDDQGGIEGLDGAPIRAQIDPRGQISGGIVHTKFFGPRIITFNGVVYIQSVVDRQSGAAMAAVMAVELAVISALETQLNSATNLSWTPSGGSGQSISCTYGTDGGEIKFTGTMLEKRFTFSLVAADPDIN